MKTIGLLGGMSWESSALYYRLMNELVKERRGGLASASILMHSFDFSILAGLLNQGRWDEIAGLLCERAAALESAGAECMVIGTNTMHKVARKVQEAIDIPLLHIADAVGREIERRGFSKVALMGTKFTMQEDFYHSRLKNKFGVEVLVPEQGTQDYVNDLIFSELCRGVFTTEAHGRFLEILDELASRGAEAAVLGCTEIPLLIKPDDTGLALIDTTGLHARMAVDFALGA